LGSLETSRQRPGVRCRANMAHTRRSSPDCDRGMSHCSGKRPYNFWSCSLFAQKRFAAWVEGDQARARERESSLLTTYWSESTLPLKLFGGSASRHGSLNFLFQVALHLPSNCPGGRRPSPSQKERECLGFRGQDSLPLSLSFVGSMPLPPSLPLSLPLPLSLFRAFWG